MRRQREFVAKLIGEDPRQVHVAEEGSELVGYVMCQKEMKPPLEMAYKWGYITDLYVGPAYRGRVVGRKLMQACMEYLKLTGNERVRLSVWHMNRNAMDLYASLGFRPHLDILQADL